MNKEFLNIINRKIVDKTMVQCLSRLYPIKCMWQTITERTFTIIREVQARAGDAAQWVKVLVAESDLHS